MAQSFTTRKTKLRVGPRAGETVFSAQPYYYGTISTSEMAAQISQESALTQADVIGVLERAAHYCRTHMALGYKVRFNGIGLFYNDLITSQSVSEEKLVTARLIKTVRPAFSPEYTIVNGSFRYSLLPEKIELTKVDFKGNAMETESPEVPPVADEPENPDVV